MLHRFRCTLRGNVKVTFVVTLKQPPKGQPPSGKQPQGLPLHFNFTFPRRMQRNVRVTF